MTHLLHSALVVLTLVSQLLGSVAVLCIEADGRVVMEFGVSDCCEDNESGAAVDDADACRACQDVTLSAGELRDRAEIQALRVCVLDVGPLRVPCCALACPETVPGAPARAPIVAPSIVGLVSRTVVLTC